MSFVGRRSIATLCVASCALVISACDSDGGAAGIGPSGGEVAGGGARVMVPAGALGSEVEVGVAAATGSLAAPPAGFALAGTPIAFTPHGTSFDAPVTIVVPHDGSATGAVRLDDESDTTWEMVSTTSIDGSSVTLQVTGFSVIAAVRSEEGVDAGVPEDGGGGGVDAGVGMDAGAVADAGGGDTDAGPPVGPSGPCDGRTAGEPCATVPDGFEGLCIRSSPGLPGPDTCVINVGCSSFSAGMPCFRPADSLTCTAVTEPEGTFFVCM